MEKVLDFLKAQWFLLAAILIVLVFFIILTSVVKKYKRLVSKFNSDDWSGLEPTGKSVCAGARILSAIGLGKMTDIYNNSLYMLACGRVLADDEVTFLSYLDKIKGKESYSLGLFIKALYYKAAGDGENGREAFDKFFECWSRTDATDNILDGIFNHYGENDAETLIRENSVKNAAVIKLIRKIYA